MMCVQKSEINAWEAGKSLPTGNLIAKMDKVLGVKLPRPQKHWKPTWSLTMIFYFPIQFLI